MFLSPSAIWLRIPTNFKQQCNNKNNVIKTNTFNVYFHNKFLKLWIILTFPFTFLYTHTTTHTLSLSLSLSIYLSIYLSLSLFLSLSLSLMGRVLTNDPGDLGSIPGHVISKTIKMVLDTPLLNTQQYKVVSRVKWSNTGKRVAASPLPWSSSYWKKSLQFTFD